MSYEPALAVEIPATSAFGPWRVVFLCSLVAFLDGFDTQSIGPAASSIADALQIPVNRFGPVFSASQVGFMLGALAFGALGDRFGRKRLLVVATLLFGLCSLGTALSASYGALFAFRALAGFGLGGATPNFVGLAGEYAPPIERARIVSMMWAAVPLGGMVGSFGSSLLLPTLGWQAMFSIGAAAPVALAVALALALPESAETAAAEGAAAPVSLLFAPGQRVATIWLWLASFMTWMVLVAVAFWTPALLQRAGLSVGSAAAILAINNAGGVVGTLLVGATLGRGQPHRKLVLVFGAAAAALAAMALTIGSFAGLAAAAGLAGFFCSAAGGGIVGVSAATYPSRARATGVGWALSFGRIGSILGPMLAGLLVARDWPSALIFAAAAIPALAAAAFVLLLGRATPRATP